MNYQDILYRLDGHVATISLNRPDKLNAWTQLMEKEVRAALEAADRDEQVRIIVLTGEGRGFCAGADMSLIHAVMGEFDRSEAIPDGGHAQEVDRIEHNYRHKFSYLLGISKPIVAAINGPCAGIGLCISLFCDLRFMADNARLTTAFARLGLVAEHGSAWMLPRLVGTMNALDLLYSSRSVAAAEAQSMGLVRVLPAENFLPQVQAWAAELASQSSPRSLRIIKRQVFASLFQDLSESWQMADEEMLESFSCEDFKEGVAHFTEKRAPAFTGR